jgi:hypothetical protein
MIRLSATTKILQLVATGTGNCYVSGSDHTTSTYGGFDQETAVTASTQTICDAPAASTVRDIDNIFFRNTAGASNTITPQTFNSSGSVTTPLGQWTLASGDIWEYTHAGGVKVTDSNGNIKSTAGLVIGASLIGGTATRVLFEAAGPVLADSATLTFNSATSVLTVNGSTFGTNSQVGGTLGVTGATTLSAALTYGGVTLTNAVTGTGKMVLDTSPTIATPVINSAAHVGGVWVADATWTLPAVTLGGTVSGTDATDSTSPTTGAFKTAGGLGAAKALWVGGLANVAGTLTVSSAESSTFAGPLIITQTASQFTDLVGAAGGDRLRMNVDVAGGGTLFRSMNNAVSDYEPFILQAESVTLHYRPGVGATAAGITLNSSGNTTLAGTLTVNGHSIDLGSAAANISNTSSYFAISAASQFIAKAGAGAGISLRVNASDSDSLIISSAGNTILAGTLAVSGNQVLGSGAGTLRLTDGARIGADSTNNLLDDASNGAGTASLYIGNAQITAVSDSRLKRNRELTKRDAVALLDLLQVEDFYYDDPSDKSLFNKNSRGKMMGIVAQQAVAYVPWLVNAPNRFCSACAAGLRCDDHPSSWYFDYAGLSAVNTRAIQQLNARMKAAGI